MTWRRRKKVIKKLKLNLCYIRWQTKINLLENLLNVREKDIKEIMMCYIKGDRYCFTHECDSVREITEEEAEKKL